MKTRIKLQQLAIFAIFCLFQWACSEEAEDIGTSISEEPSVIQFEGLTVRHSYGTPVGFLSSRDLQQTYVSLVNENMNTNYFSVEETPALSVSLFAEVYEEQSAHYPNLRDLNEDTYAQIQEAFIDLTTEEIEQHFEQIALYYQININYDVLTKMASLVDQPTKSNGRMQSDGDFDTISDCELAVLVQHPQAALPFTQAFRQVDDLTEARYGTNLGGDGRANAFKHGIWNALMVDRYIAINKFSKLFSSRAKKREFVDWAVSLAALFANAHEECAGTNSNDFSRHMDLRNNHIGREAVRSSVSYSFQSIVSTPSTAQISQGIYNHATAAQCACQVNMQCVWQIPNSRMIYLKNPDRSDCQQSSDPTDDEPCPEVCPRGTRCIGGQCMPG